MNLLLFLYLLAIAPKLLLNRWLKGKRHPGFLQRLGVALPSCPERSIWIHACSIGEVKAASPLINALRKQNPTASILLTTTTATGQREAARTQAHFTAYLPLDFTFTVKRWVKKVKPSLFILIESDFWPNLLKELKKSNVRVILASGKMSSRSAKRFRAFLFFSKNWYSSYHFYGGEIYVSCFNSDPS